jgi:hypothetical protein
MPITIVARNGTHVRPAVVCDRCGREITDAKDGTVWYLLPAGGEAPGPPAFAHKACGMELEEQLAGRSRGRVGSEDLDAWLVYLERALRLDGATRAAAEAHAELLGQR